MSNIGMVKDEPPFDIVHTAFPLPTTESSALQGALKNGFGEAVVTCDMPEPRELPSLDTCQKRFLRTHKEGDLAPHPFVSLALQVGDAEKLPRALGLESLDPFLRDSKQGPLLTAVEENGNDKRFVQLELACKADDVRAARP